MAAPANTGKTKKRAVAEINVVPYIDVMLVLLVVFMVTAPLLMQGVKVELPQSNATPLEDTDEEPLIVSIDAAGSLFLNLGDDPEAPRTLADVTDTVSKVLKNKPTTAVLVWGDSNVPYGQVVSLMSDLQGAGAVSVGLVTEPNAL